MAIGRQDIKVLAQILADGAGLGGRLHYYEVLRHFLISDPLLGFIGLKNTKPQTVPRFNYVLGSELSRKLVNRINV